MSAPNIYDAGQDHTKRPEEYTTPAGTPTPLVARDEKGTLVQFWTQEQIEAAILTYGADDIDCCIQNQGERIIRLQAELEAAQGEIAALLDDKARIDLLESKGEWHIATDYEDGYVTLDSVDGNINDREYNERGRGDTVREAIDAARKAK